MSGTRPSPRSGIFAVLLCCASMLAGCARVAPYERETLARRDMLSGQAPHDLLAGEQHARDYREGSSGGTGETQGGGCGCN